MLLYTLLGGIAAIGAVILYINIGLLRTAQFLEADLRTVSELVQKGDYHGIRGLIRRALLDKAVLLRHEGLILTRRLMERQLMSESDAVQLISCLDSVTVRLRRSDTELVLLPTRSFRDLPPNAWNALGVYAYSWDRWNACSRYHHRVLLRLAFKKWRAA